MTIRLRLLDRVAWDDTDLPGDRPAALLAALAIHPDGLADARLAAEVWGEQQPDRPTKALQVLVSRLRSVDRSLVERREGGYRLGLAREDVDAWVAQDRLADAVRWLRGGEPDRAAAAAGTLAATVVVPGAPGALGELRRSTARDLRDADRVHGVALARCGRAEEALPLLLAVHAQRPDDTEVLIELLRAEGRTAGAPAALERYETYRRGLSDRLGVDPDPALQRVHRELLASDSPQHTGIRYDADELLGRSDDLTRLRAALATGRLTTILGPGGIGKTRIAHVLAREAPQPRIHVVELVGIASGDDVVAEVGAALGIRGSVTARRELTPSQQADVRGRLAQELDSGPTLLVLDNCEHVLEATASLVAFLLVTTRDLSVLTTSRAPLRIAAERAVPLTQLAPDHAADLFARRAAAARPDVVLDPAAVAAVVARLDGLPLAIELAAARVRTMTVEEIRAALDDRFGLLRSRDRSAPERHRTLTAVIDWSWALLTDAERAAAARLSVFHDGFDAGAARSVLGPDAMDLVEALVDQSIVTVADAGGTTRFRMLETIREYAAQRLVEGGDHDAALAAQDAWATDLVLSHGSVFFAADQVRTVDALLAEENNLTDVLRRALARSDATTATRLLGTLGSLWTITGNHARVFAVADAAQELVSDWDPTTAAERDAGFEIAFILLVHLGWIPGRDTSDLRQAISRWGEPDHPWARASQAMFLVEDELDVVSRITALADADPDPHSAAMLLLWAAINAENVGDVAGARAHAERALAAGDLTPYLKASLHAQLSQLAMYDGDHHRAARHAEIAWPLLMRLHAYDDASSARFTVAVSLLLDGDFDGCEALLDSVGELPDRSQLGSRMLLRSARAELALARGEVEEGLALYDGAVEEVSIEIPGWSGGLTPWLLIAASAALGARARHSPPGHDPRADELRELLLSRAGRARDGATPMEDLPLSGVLLVGLAAWALRFGDNADFDVAIRLLAIAHRWAYNRSLPSLAWEPMAQMADEARPGLLDSLLAKYADQAAPDLVPEVRNLLGSLTSSG